MARRLIVKPILKRGSKVYLKKTGESHFIDDYNKKDKTYSIVDEYGTGFYGIKQNEFKKLRKKGL